VEQFQLNSLLGGGGGVTIQVKLTSDPGTYSKLLSSSLSVLTDELLTIVRINATADQTSIGYKGMHKNTSTKHTSTLLLKDHKDLHKVFNKPLLNLE